MITFLCFLLDLHFEMDIGRWIYLLPMLQDLCISHRLYGSK